MNTTFKIDDLVVDGSKRWAMLESYFEPETPYSELSEEEQEQKFMDVLTNGLPNFNIKRFSGGVKYSPVYKNSYNRYNSKSSDTIVTVPKNKKWYDQFR